MGKSELGKREYTITHISNNNYNMKVINVPPNIYRQYK